MSGFDDVFPVNTAVDNQTNVVSSTQAMRLSPKPVTKSAGMGTVSLLPCKVCNAASSGYHYGVNTCEACKAFFRRSISNKGCSIRPCQVDGSCAENPSGGKISCSGCRFNKCLRLGMAKEGSKRGRYTAEKKSQNTKEMQRMKADELLTRNFELEHCDEMVAALSHQFKKCFSQIQLYYDGMTQINSQVMELTMQEQLKKGEPLTRVLYSPGHSPSLEVKKWYDTLREHLIYASCNPGESSISTSSAEQMIYKEWGSQEEKTFYGLSAFAKALPGFSELLLEDRILLLKDSKTECFDVIKHQTIHSDIEAKVHFYEKSGDLILFPATYMRRLMGNELINSVLRVAEKLQRLALTAEDVAVLLAFVIFTPDREGLQRPDDVSALQAKMLPVLHYVLRKNHPDQLNILPNTLLILSSLRENAIIGDKYLRAAGKLIKADDHPLLSEMMRM